jgi:hypothetical protein
LLLKTDVKAVLEIYETLGPTPCLCIEFPSEPQLLPVYKNQLNDAISNITTDKLEQLTQDSSQLIMDTTQVSHKLCLIRCHDRNDVLSEPIVSPITDSIKSRLSNQLRNLQQAERIRLFQQLDRVPGASATAGIVYEAQARYLLQQGRHLDLIPMVKLENGQER